MSTSLIILLWACLAVALLASAMSRNKELLLWHVWSIVILAPFLVLLKVGQVAKRNANTAVWRKK